MTNNGRTRLIVLLLAALLVALVAPGVEAKNEPTPGEKPTGPIVDQDGPREREQKKLIGNLPDAVKTALLFPEIRDTPALGLALACLQLDALIGNLLLSQFLLSLSSPMIVSSAALLGQLDFALIKLPLIATYAALCGPPFPVSPVIVALIAIKLQMVNLLPTIRDLP